MNRSDALIESLRMFEMRLHSSLVSKICILFISIRQEKSITVFQTILKNLLDMSSPNEKNDSTLTSCEMRCKEFKCGIDDTMDVFMSVVRMKIDVMRIASGIEYPETCFEFKMPDSRTTLSSLLRECTLVMFTNMHLFRTDISGDESLRNYKTIQDEIKKCINLTIGKVVPILGTKFFQIDPNKLNTINLVDYSKSKQIITQITEKLSQHFNNQLQNLSSQLQNTITVQNEITSQQNSKIQHLENLCQEMLILKEKNVILEKQIFHPQEKTQQLIDFDIPKYDDFSDTEEISPDYFEENESHSDEDRY